MVLVMRSYTRVHDALRRVLYWNGVHLDPYTVMEAATLLSRYFDHCDKSSLEGFELLMGKALRDAGASVDLEHIIREVARVANVGCEENHRLRS